MLDKFKLKAFADNKFDLDQMMLFVFERIENILGKGENAGYQHFSLLLSQGCEELGFFEKGFGKRLIETADV